jgi:uncharacterized membrane protein
MVSHFIRERLPLQEMYTLLTDDVAIFVKAASALIIAAGSVEALYQVVRVFFTRGATLVQKKAIWTRYAMWLVLGLEFELAADIIRTAIAPSWSDIGQLAAIAAIRTFLNYFLQRDIQQSTTVVT